MEPRVSVAVAGGLRRDVRVIGLVSLWRTALFAVGMGGLAITAAVASQSDVIADHREFGEVPAGAPGSGPAGDVRTMVQVRRLAPARVHA